MVFGGGTNFVCDVVNWNVLFFSGVSDEVVFADALVGNRVNVGMRVVIMRMIMNIVVSDVVVVVMKR